jgi:arylsulfatase A-like enzyme
MALPRRILIGGLLIFVLASFAAAAAERPNVLFIVVDDLNDWVGPLGGHPQVKTPNFDRLAARGVTFTNAHCQAPMCNPSRTSFMTGLRPSTTGVYALDPWFRTAEPLKNLVTLPQHFEQNGYVTLCTGKIHHDGFPPKDERKDGVEFSRWGFAGSHGPYPKTKNVETVSKHPMLNWGVYPGRDEEMSDYKVASWAIEQLKNPPADGKPFFLAVGFRRPHVPCLAPQKWFDLYPDDDTLIMPPIKRDDLDDVPKAAAYLHWKIPEPRLDWLEAHGEWRNLVRSYLACISFMDAQVGRVLDALDASGKADNTIIVLLSDHGWHLGEKGQTGKLSLWERSTRVPLIFAGPGIAKSARCDRTVELLDLYPTLSELAGLPARSGLEGHSIVPQLIDTTAPREFPAITTQDLNNHTVRTQRWRYIRYFDRSEELYDEQADPDEWTNLAADTNYAQTKQDLAKWLPAVNKAGVAGSVTRFFEVRADGKRYWEGKPIDEKHASGDATTNETPETAP